MPTTTHRTTDPSHDRREGYRNKIAQEITAAGGKTDAFLRELDAEQLHLDDLVARFIVQKEHDYFKFADQLRDKYKFFARQPVTGNAPQQHVPNEVVNQGPSGPMSTSAEAIPEHASEQKTTTDGTFDSTAPKADAQNQTADAVQPGVTPNPADSNTGPTLGPRRSSAIRSGTTSPRAPRKKRVSLVVGDEVVAPSDTVQATIAVAVQDQDQDQAANDNAASHASILSSLRKNGGNGNAAVRKPLTLDETRKLNADKENALFDEFAPESPFLMDEEPAYMPALDDDKDDLEGLSEEMDVDGKLTSAEMEMLSSSPALAIPHRIETKPVARRQTFSLQMLPTVMQPVTSGFSMPNARIDPTGSPERFEARPVNDELLFGSLTHAGPGSFQSVSMIGSQLQSIYLSSDRKSKPV